MRALRETAYFAGQDIMHIWDRQPDEGAKAFEAFVAYRDMIGRRSQRAVAEKLGKSETLISRWSSQHRWRDRVASWDHGLTTGDGSPPELGEEISETLHLQVRAQRKVASELLRRLEEDPTYIRDLDHQALVQLARHLDRDQEGLLRLQVLVTRGDIATPDKPVTLGYFVGRLVNGNVGYDELARLLDALPFGDRTKLALDAKGRLRIPVADRGVVSVDGFTEGQLTLLQNYCVVIKDAPSDAPGP